MTVASFEIASSAGSDPTAALQARRQGDAYVVQGEELDRIARAFAFYKRYWFVALTTSLMDVGVRIHEEPQRSEHMKQHEKMR